MDPPSCTSFAIGASAFCACAAAKELLRSRRPEVYDRRAFIQKQASERAVSLGSLWPIMDWDRAVWSSE